MLMISRGKPSPLVNFRTPAPGTPHGREHEGFGNLHNDGQTGGGGVKGPIWPGAHCPFLWNSTSFPHPGITKQPPRNHAPH